MAESGTNVKITAAASDKKEQREVTGDKGRILVIDGHPAVRQELVQLINQGSSRAVGLEVENTGQLLDAFEKQRVDLVIVDVSLENTTGFRLVERIKLKCPNLPVLVLSMHNEALYAENALPTAAKAYAINQEEAEQIIRAVEYMQSLLESQVFGFTVIVRI